MPKKSKTMPWDTGAWDQSAVGKTYVDDSGVRWQSYPDPASPTGYTAKRSDDNGDSFNFINGPTTDVRASNQATADALKEDRASQNRYVDTLNTENTRRFDVGSQQIAQAERNRVDQVKNALKEQKRQYDMTFGEGKAEFQQNFGQRQYEFNANNALATRGADLSDKRLGLDVLNSAADKRGALNFLEGDALAQGANSAGLSPYIQALQSGRPVAYGGGTATQGNPTPLTLGTMANAITGAGSGAAAGTDAYGRPLLSPANQTFVNAASKTYQQGLANQPLGFMENMTDEQRKALADAGGWLGRNVASENQYYQRSRPGQGSAFAG